MLDLKSVITGEYKYTYEEVENIVLQFNEKYNVAILIKDVCKELQFTYGIDMDITRTARVSTAQVVKGKESRSFAFFLCKNRESRF